MFCRIPNQMNIIILSNINRGENPEASGEPQTLENKKASSKMNWLKSGWQGYIPYPKYIINQSVTYLKTKLLADLLTMI